MLRNIIQHSKFWRAANTHAHNKYKTHTCSVILTNFIFVLMKSGHMENNTFYTSSLPFLKLSKKYSKINLRKNTLIGKKQLRNRYIKVARFVYCNVFCYYLVILKCFLCNVQKFFCIFAYLCLKNTSFIGAYPLFYL